MNNCEIKKDGCGSSLNLRVFIQARMSSSRYPGKVLAPFKGRPIVAHVVDKIAQSIPKDRIVLLTSIEPSDDPLALFVRDIGVNVYRGSLNKVFDRFRGCLKEHPCNWFFRVCADSPLIDAEILNAMCLRAERSDVDLITNIQIRTFPKGHSAELIRSETFAKIDSGRLTPDEQEHITKVYYNYPEKFRIINVESGNQLLTNYNYCVDTVDDILRLEQMIGANGTISR